MPNENVVELDKKVFKDMRPWDNLEDLDLLHGHVQSHVDLIIPVKKVFPVYMCKN